MWRSLYNWVTGALGENEEALFAAVEQDNLPEVRNIVEGREVNINAKKNEKTALELSFDRNCFAIFAYLFARPDIQRQTYFLGEAIKRGNLQMINYFLAEGQHIMTFDLHRAYDDRSALFLAVEYNHGDIVDRLLQEGAIRDNPNTGYEKHWTTTQSKTVYGEERLVGGRYGHWEQEEITVQETEEHYRTMSPLYQAAKDNNVGILNSLCACPNINFQIGYFHQDGTENPERITPLGGAIKHKCNVAIHCLGVRLGFTQDNFVVIRVWSSGFVDRGQYPSVRNLTGNLPAAEIKEVAYGHRVVVAIPGHVSITTQLGHYSLWPRKLPNEQRHFNTLDEDIQDEHGRPAERVVILHSLDINALHQKFQEMSGYPDLAWNMGKTVDTWINPHEQSCATFARHLLDAAGIRKLITERHVIYDQVLTTPDNVRVFAEEAKRNEVARLPYTRDFLPPSGILNVFVPEPEVTQAPVLSSGLRL